MRLDLSVELQCYGETKEEEQEYLENLRNVLVQVIDLMQFSVGTFVHTVLIRTEEGELFTEPKEVK